MNLACIKCGKLPSEHRVRAERLICADGAEGAWEELDSPRVGDGTPDAALAIAEHAFRAGYAACEADNAKPAYAIGLDPAGDAWAEYEPSEDIKALS